MEMNNEDGFLEELEELRRIEEAWENKPPSSLTATSEINGFFSTTSWGFDVLDSTPLSPNSYQFNFSSSSSFPDEFYPPLTSPDEAGHVAGTCKPEPAVSGDVLGSLFCGGMCNENKSRNKMKKIGGQPSKNLMAERRRRKRLNDRLSMLRSVVPKISKDISSKKMIGIGDLRSGVYHLKTTGNGHALVVTKIDSTVWPQRLGHPSVGNLSILSRICDLKLDKEQSSCCDICLRAKQTQNPFPLSESRGT